MSTRKRLDEPRMPHPFDFKGTLVSCVSTNPMILHCRLCHREWKPDIAVDGKVAVGYSVCPEGCSQGKR